MKVMLNNLVNYQVSSPIVCGILVEGKTCSLYKMDLTTPDFYRMIMLESFPWCTSRTELCLLPNMFIYFDCLFKGHYYGNSKKCGEKGCRRYYYFWKAPQAFF
ncbi:unnamed protein product [Absidia cylindrospora]